ncbi:hypothetical protein VPHF88_0111 [Vibrio phage F88]
MFCKHDWNLIQETTTESKAEQNVRLFGQNPAPRNRLDYEEFHCKYLITTFSCNKCGKLKRYKDKF